MRLLGAAAAAMVLTSAEAYAQASLKTANELAKKRISDNKSACSQFIIAAIEQLENARKARGEASCLGGQSADGVVNAFVRAILADYAYSDAPPAAAIETIYKDHCARP